MTLIHYRFKAPLSNGVSDYNLSDRDFQSANTIHETTRINTKPNVLALFRVILWIVRRSLNLKSSLEELTVTRLRILVLSGLPVFLFSVLCLSAPAATNAAQHGFSFKEYEKFHDVLHPLEHDALPKKDYRRIRSQANLLVKRGNAIVKLGVPSGTTEDKKEEFAKELDSFRKALAKFRTVARRGTNDQLKASYSAVHDSFEMLAGMLR